MYVRAHRAHGFQVGDKYFSVQRSTEPQFLPDEVRANPSFDFVLKTGELVEIVPQAPTPEPERLQSVPSPEPPKETQKEIPESAEQKTDTGSTEPTATSPQDQQQPAAASVEPQPTEPATTPAPESAADSSQTSRGKSTKTSSGK